VDNYGVKVLDLSKVVCKDDPWIMANRAAQVFYAEQVLSPNDKKKITNHLKHVVFPEKQQAIGVDGVSDLDESLKETHGFLTFSYVTIYGIYVTN